MLQLILSNKHYINVTAPSWQAVLDICIAQNLNALVDSGALLAGSANREVAGYLIAHYKGVVFYEPEREMWMILDQRGRCELKYEPQLGFCFLPCLYH